MINKDSFVKIVDGLRDYWDAFGVFQDSLNVYMEHNFMTDIFHTIMEALFEDVELNIDDDMGPILYYYAAECDWGRNEKAKEGLLAFEGERMPLTSAEELYDYLMLDNEICEYVKNSVREEMEQCLSSLL